MPRAMGESITCCSGRCFRRRPSRVRRRLESEPALLAAWVIESPTAAMEMGIGAASVLLSAFGGHAGPLWSGVVYWLVGPVLWLNARLSSGARKRLQTSGAPEPAGLSLADD